MNALSQDDFARAALPRMRRGPAKGSVGTGPLQMVAELRDNAMRALDSLVLTFLDGINTEDGLDDVIDQLIMDPGYRSARRALSELCSFESSVEEFVEPSSSSSSIYALFASIADESSVKKDLATAGEYETQIRICMLSFYAHRAEQKKKPAPKEQDQPVDILSLFAKPGMPPEFLRAFVAREQTMVCEDILWAAVMRDKTHHLDQQWLVAAVARRWKEGAFEYLRFVAAAPGVNPPSADVISAEQILDPVKLIATAWHAELGYQECLKQAIADEARSGGAGGRS